MPGLNRDCLLLSLKCSKGSAAAPTSHLGHSHLVYQRLKLLSAAAPTSHLGHSHLVLPAFEITVCQAWHFPKAPQQLPRAIWAAAIWFYHVLPAFETAVSSLKCSKGSAAAPTSHLRMPFGLTGHLGGTMWLYRPSRLPFARPYALHRLRSSVHEPFGPQPSGFTAFETAA